MFRLSSERSFIGEMPSSKLHRYGVQERLGLGARNLDEARRS